MRKEDGGPAFPESYVGADAPHEGIGGGMSLRDYFAAMALNGLNANCGVEMRVKDAVELAYEQADAMLKARSE